MLLEVQKEYCASGQLPCKPTPEQGIVPKPKQASPPIALEPWARARLVGRPSPSPRISQDIRLPIFPRCCSITTNTTPKHFLLLSLPTHDRRPWFCSIRSWNSLLHCPASLFYFFNCSARSVAALSLFHTATFPPLLAFPLSQTSQSARCLGLRLAQHPSLRFCL
jgi:hypothetical protein